MRPYMYSFGLGKDMSMIPDKINSIMIDLFIILASVLDVRLIISLPLCILSCKLK